MAQPNWGDDWSVDVRVWVERSGHAILGKGRLELLEGIERFHSIRAAAQQMSMSYRRAWLLVQSINAAAGAPIVVAATGGSRGGGTRLTALGQQAVRIFREIQQELRHAAATLLPRLVQRPDTPVLHVAAAVSLEEVLGQLLADYALRQPKIGVRTIFGASDELAGHLLAGGSADLFLTADVRQLDRLKAARQLTTRRWIVLAENSLAAIAPQRQTLPVRKPADLVRPKVRRLALAAATVPLGAYTRAYLEAHGLYEKLLSRAVFMENSRAVLTAVKSGQADAGLVYGSDAARATECRLLFHIPHPPQSVRYLAAVLARSSYPSESAAFCEFLRSPPAAERWREYGFTPAQQR